MSFQFQNVWSNRKLRLNDRVSFSKTVGLRFIRMKIYYTRLDLLTFPFVKFKLQTIIPYFNTVI